MSTRLLTLVDGFLATGSFTLFAFSAALALRDTRHTLQGCLLIALLVCLTFLSFTMVPGTQMFSPPLFTFSKAIGVFNLGLLWWLCLSVLRDDFRVGLREGVGLVAISFVPSVYFVEHLGIDVPFGGTVSRLGSLPPMIMVGHVVWVALSERSTDLVEPRRRARLLLVLAPLLALLVSLLTESMDNPHLAAILRSALGVLPVQLALLFWLSSMRADPLQFKPQARAIADEPRVDPKDLALHRRLMQVIETDHVYLRPGLTIDELADLLKAPTHQLRHLINTGMGFRNFSAFLNGYRLAHAKSALSDLDRARDTVLAIAYEAGFSSLQSFNRVFKEMVGQTPTDFRSAALSAHAQN
jgi:AraC-like DNA-binding protein